MEQGKYFGSLISLLILTIITFIITVIGLSSVFAGNVFIFDLFVQFCGYLGTLLVQVIGNFFILIIDSLSFIFTRDFSAVPFIVMGVPNFNFFTSFYRSAFILFLISSICFLIYFILTRNSNWSIVSFICIVMIILMAALTPIFVDLFDTFFMNLAMEKVFGGMIYTIIQLSVSIFFIVFLSIISIIFIYMVVKKRMGAILYLFLILISVVFLNTFSQNFYPDYLFISMELSNLSLSIQLKPHIYQTLLSAFYISNLLSIDLQNFISLLVYAYYLTPISSYLISPEFFSSFFALLFLEMSIQTSYFQEVYFPTRERGSRLQREIDELEKRIEKLKESKASEEKEKVTEGGIHSISVRRFFSSEAFDYLREMMEKRQKIKKPKLKSKEKEEEYLKDDDAQHLLLYIEEKFLQDSNARRTLAAEAISPNMSKVLDSTVISMIYRLITFLFLIIILFNATTIFQTIGSPIIRMSIEILTPTVMALILFPMILAFPVIGSIIKIRRFPKEEPKKSGIFDIGFGLMALAIALIFVIIGGITFLPEFIWISIPFWIFGAIELIYGLIQMIR
ncbi:MAG: hypothetical protein ACTSO9_05125 [Candidatus Helarchaeota archaeon]